LSQAIMVSLIDTLQLHSPKILTSPLDKQILTSPLSVYQYLTSPLDEQKLTSPLDEQKFDQSSRLPKF
jgi:hypothetical protein